MRVEAPSQIIRPYAFQQGLQLTDAETDAMAQLQGAIDNGQAEIIGSAVVDKRIHRNTSNVLRDLPPAQLGSALILGENTRIRHSKESKLHLGDGAVIIDSHIEGGNIAGSVIEGSRIRRGAVLNSLVKSSSLTDTRLDAARVNRVGSKEGTQIYGSTVTHGTIFDSAVDEDSSVHGSHLRKSVVTASGLLYVSATDSLIYDTPLMEGTAEQSLTVIGETIRHGRVETRNNRRALSSSSA